MEQLVKNEIKRRLWPMIVIPSLIAGLIVSPVLLSSYDSTTESGESSGEVVTETINLSEQVESYRPLMKKYTEAEGIPELTDLLLAIMMVESRGQGQDVMQSSESLGLPVNTLTAERSIEQAVKYFKGCYEAAKELGNDLWTAVASYNFGGGYNTFVSKHGKQHTTKLAEEYSRTVVAPSLGNLSGITYSYPNPVAIPYNGGFLYLNGGNFFYTDLVKQYLTLSASGGETGTAGGSNQTSATGWKKDAIARALKDVGQAFPTGWGQRGECIVAVQGWINGARPGSWIPGGVRAGYLQSGAKEVSWSQARAGDVIQYENLTQPELFAEGVHTMMIQSVNGDQTVNIIESNNPGGSGLVGQRSNLTNTAPSGWRAVVWRFPD